MSERDWAEIQRLRDQHERDLIQVREAHAARRMAEAERSDLLAEVKRLRDAVATHARTLDDRAIGHPDYVARDRDSIDNDLYNVVRALDPAWWDRRVPGLGAVKEESA